MTVFRFREADRNPAHVRVDVFAGPDADHLALSGTLTFRVDEFPAFADALTQYNERQEGGEERTEFQVRWHASHDDDGISLTERHIIDREEADRVGQTKVGIYDIVRWTVWRRLHRIYADGSSWTGPWSRSDGGQEGGAA